MENKVDLVSENVVLLNSDINEIIESLKINVAYKYKNGFDSGETSRVLKKMENVMYSMLINNIGIIN